MRLFAVTPIHVTDTELARRQARYRRLCPPGVTLDLVDIGADAPTAMDTAAQIEAAEELMVAALRDAPSGYDGLLPDCVLDPAVTALGDDRPVPVFGILRLSIGYALATGRRVGAVTRNRAIADALVAQVGAYGWADHFVGVRVLDLDFDAIADDERWNAALGGAVDELAERGADWIVNGCSAVEVVAAAGRARVVDPVETALRLVGAAEVTG
ncbi:Asp/Glu/hydantoin racemase [Jatrophihabitans endophyticus]|uniref:Asp/Glu/hydantoin racemase n=1 Tax=Jatrophihabitans endophyticus TaxID=1206085 RepID=A0A1M5M1E9_9ACTN|nr:aspartate/glutamate racemase family protein [Jatrophihabitans endophyticus]SHG70503.1 Asp/Glu/hydantoin racemase [Jatrophihabitans endophyticus]